MAELGIIASVLQIADVGIRLSLRLYTFGETVASADRSIISISKDVSLTSSVLKELGQTLDRDKASKLYSENAVKTAGDIVNECLEVFEEMDKMILKKMPNSPSTSTDRRIRAALVLERVKWPFLKTKMELLRSNLDRMKSTLVLMLNVIAYAKQVSDKTELPSVVAAQRTVIEDLARSNEEYVHSYEKLRLSLADGASTASSCQRTPRPGLSTRSPPARPARDVSNGSFMVLAGDESLSTKSQSRHFASTATEEYNQNTEMDNFDELGQALEHLERLAVNLLREVSSPEYSIEDVTRSRIRKDISETHVRETRQARRRFWALKSPTATKTADMEVQKVSEPMAMLDPKRVERLPYLPFQTEIQEISNAIIDSDGRRFLEDQTHRPYDPTIGASPLTLDQVPYGSFQNFYPRSSEEARIPFYLPNLTYAQSVEAGKVHAASATKEAESIVEVMGFYKDTNAPNTRRGQSNGIRKRREPSQRISAPDKFSHVTHIGHDSKTGTFTGLRHTDTIINLSLPNLFRKENADNEVEVFHCFKNTDRTSHHKDSTSHHKDTTGSSHHTFKDHDIINELLVQWTTITNPPKTNPPFQDPDIPSPAGASPAL